MALLVAGCVKVQKKPADMPAMDEPRAQQDVTVQPITGNEDAPVVEADETVHLSDFSFSPAVLQVKAGKTLWVKLVNATGSHDFVIDELNVQSSVLEENQEAIVKIEVPQDVAGEKYRFYSSVDKDRARGMEGTLEVIE